jgi:hypothetical protein
VIFSPHFLGEVAASKFVENLLAGKLTIDNSEYSTWTSCFPMGLYNGALRRVGARARAPLAFGGAIHAGLDAFFNGEPDWQGKALADAAITGLDALGDPKRNSNKLMDLLASYILHYQNSHGQFQILELNGKPLVEQSFVVPFGTIKVQFQGRELEVVINWSGKIDLLTTYEGAVTPVDHKTTTVMGEKFVDDKVRSTQMLGYTYASRFFSKDLFNNMPVFGTRINALAMRSSGYEFKVFDIPYVGWKVDEWHSETLLSIRSLIHQLDIFLSTKGEAVPTREHCVTKYGKCPYFDVCDAAPVMRDRMIFDDAYYFISDWSPLNE